VFARIGNDLQDHRAAGPVLDAGRFIETLSKAIHERPEWLTATRLLPVTAEGRGSVMFAQIALIKAKPGQADKEG
jgi:hypothetical protein